MNKTEQFKLNSAVFIYKKDSDYYLEHRKALIKDNNITFGLGIPFSEEKYKEIAESIKIENKRKYVYNSIKAKNLLYFNNDGENIELIWFKQGNVKKLKFDKQSEIVSGNYWLPNLVFRVFEKNLYVYAVKTSNVKDNTILYNAPFPNVNNINEVCQGNVEINNDFENLEDIMQEYEKFFFNSEFTHLNNTKVTKSKISDVYNEITNKPIKFPNNQLIKFKQFKQIL